MVDALSFTGRLQGSYRHQQVSKTSSMGTKLVVLSFHLSEGRDECHQPGVSLGKVVTTARCNGQSRERPGYSDSDHRQAEETGSAGIAGDAAVAATAAQAIRARTNARCRGTHRTSRMPTGFAQIAAEVAECGRRGGTVSDYAGYPRYQFVGGVLPVPEDIGAGNRD